MRKQVINIQVRVYSDAECITWVTKETRALKCKTLGAILLLHAHLWAGSCNVDDYCMRVFCRVQNG